MKTAALLLLLAAAAQAELRVPAVTAYTDPNPNTPLKKWAESGQKVLWFGEIKKPGKLTVALAIKLPAKAKAQFRLTVAGQADRPASFY